MDNELFESVHQYIPWLNCQRVRALILKQATGGGMLTTLLHTSADGGTSTQRLQIAEPFIHNVVLGGHRDERSVRTSFYILPTVCKPFRNARWNRQLILVEITIACC